MQSWKRLLLWNSQTVIYLSDCSFCHSFLRGRVRSFDFCHNCSWRDNLLVWLFWLSNYRGSSETSTRILQKHCQTALSLACEKTTRIAKFNFGAWELRASLRRLFWVLSRASVVAFIFIWKGLFSFLFSGLGVVMADVHEFFHRVKGRCVVQKRNRNLWKLNSCPFYVLWSKWHQCVVKI